jgi:hypothetical protein
MMVKDRVIRRMAKNSPKFVKSSPNSSQTKKIKAQVEIPKHLHQLLFFTKNTPTPLKNSPNGKISTNLVTLVRDKIL